MGSEQAVVVDHPRFGKCGEFGEYMVVRVPRVSKERYNEWAKQVEQGI
jgi:hypothetical protein